MSANLVVISGPSGVGKTTITKKLAERLDAFLSVSATTRPQRAGEIDGQSYIFMDKVAFEAGLEKDAFLEYAQVYGGHYYGTPAAPVREALDAGRAVILEIDIEGTRQVMQLYPAATSVYILPPSNQALEERIRGRQTEAEQAIRERLNKAQAEIIKARTGKIYRRFVTNRSVDETVDEIASIVQKGMGPQAGTPGPSPG